jgi:hypothetical protein
MKRKDLAARRERNRELGQLDAAHRCQFCKKALEKLAVVRYLDGAKFCDDECLQADEERAKLVAK